MNHIAVRIGQDLNFNMARLFQILFNKNPVISKGPFGFTPCTFQPLFQLILMADNSHPFASPPAAAFIRTRYPMEEAVSEASSSPPASLSLPVGQATPAEVTSWRALVLSPIRAITSGEGPANRIPSSSHAFAKPGFSLRKP